MRLSNRNQMKLMNYINCLYENLEVNFIYETTSNKQLKTTSYESMIWIWKNLE